MIKSQKVKQVTNFVGVVVIEAVKVFIPGAMLAIVLYWWLIDFNSFVEFVKNSLLVIPFVVSVTLIVMVIDDTIGIRKIFNRLIAFIKLKDKGETEFADSIFNDGKTCVLIDGPWGRGKTRYYRENIEPVFSRKSTVIYISCFSSSKSDLINDIILANFWYKLFTFNGILSKFMESNWHSFMPKNSIIVFDDLERLQPRGENRYSDLMGIMSYLKEHNKNKLLLICDKTKIDDDTFNAYFEKVIDHEIGIEDRVPFDKVVDKILPGESSVNEFVKPFYNKVKHVIIDVYKDNSYTNLRLLKIHFSTLLNSIENIYGTKYRENSIDRNIIIEFIQFSGEEIKKAIKWNHLYMTNGNLFRRFTDFLDRTKPNYMVQPRANNIINNSQQNSTKEEEEIKLELTKYNCSIDDWSKKNPPPKRNIIEDTLDKIQKGYASFIFKKYLQYANPQENKGIEKIVHLISIMGNYIIVRVQADILQSSIEAYLENETPISRVVINFWRYLKSLNVHEGINFGPTTNYLEYGNNSNRGLMDKLLNDDNFKRRKIYLDPEDQGRLLHSNWISPVIETIIEDINSPSSTLLKKVVESRISSDKSIDGNYIKDLYNIDKEDLVSKLLVKRNDLINTSLLFQDNLSSNFEFSGFSNKDLLRLGAICKKYGKVKLAQMIIKYMIANKKTYDTVMTLVVFSEDPVFYLYFYDPEKSMTDIVKDVMKYYNLFYREYLEELFKSCEDNPTSEKLNLLITKLGNEIGATYILENQLYIQIEKMLLNIIPKGTPEIQYDNLLLLYVNLYFSCVLFKEYKMDSRLVSEIQRVPKYWVEFKKVPGFNGFD